MTHAARPAPFRPMTARGIDHAVVLGHDLEALAEDWQRLGFTLTPTARHPWGTENRVVQLDGSFVELLAIGAGSEIAPAAPGIFSFGAYNRDRLAARGEGPSMLVLESRDPDRDRADFAAAGLATFAPFGFERIARSPEGEEYPVGFDLTFTDFVGAGAEGHPDMGFFTCHQRHPENFWRAEYQAHPNTARSIAAVVLVAPEPSDVHEGLAAFAGVREFHATSAGFVLPTPRGAVEVVTPAAFRWRYGAGSLPVTPERLTFAGIRFAVADLGEAASQLIAGGFGVADRADALVVANLRGTTIAFESAPRAPSSVAEERA